MTLSTSTVTLAPGSSRTYNLAPGEAVTVATEPNCYVTVTETPDVITTADQGGQTNVRESILQYKGTWTYGPYALGGTVAVVVSLAKSTSSVAVTLGSAAAAVVGAGVGIGIEAGAGDHELNMAAEKIRTQIGSGYISLAPGGQYYINDPVVIDAAYCGIMGNGATINVSGLDADGKAITLTSSGLDQYSRFPLVREISNFTIAGVSVDGVDDRDLDFHLIYIDTGTALASVRPLFRSVRAMQAKYGVSIKSRAYYSRFLGVEILRCKFGFSQLAGGLDFAENVVFIGGSLYNNDCNLNLAGGQRVKMYGMSLVNFGDNTGDRQTSDDRNILIASGAELELFGCHTEWGYGKYAGQSNSPILLTNANSKLTMFGGKVMYVDSAQNPYYSHLIQTDNSSQIVTLESVQMERVGRLSAATSDDCLLVGSDSTHAGGACARAVVRNTRPPGVSPNDLPSCVSYANGPSWMRNGVDNPHQELSPRITVTGAATIASVGTTDGSISARNNTGSMLKITGAGTVLISLPLYEPMARHAWSMFLNGGAGTGSVTVRERHSNVVSKWNGTAGITVSQDTRNAYSDTTQTITLGTNEWRRASWKDVNSTTQQSPRQNNDFIVIEINTAGMSAGAVYIDDVGFSLM